MPKMKTHSGAKKRFRTTGTGKLRRRKANKSHLNGHKSKSRLRRLSRPADVHKSQERTVQRLLGK